MTPPLDRSASEPVPKSHDASRLHFIDATRAFALILGIVFHASLSFVPIFMGWAVQDVSTSSWVAAFATISHSFRMELFFLLAGFLGNLSLHRRGVSKFARSRLIQLGVPFIAGWFVLRPFLVSAWIMGSASLRGDVDILTGLAGGFQSLATIPSGLFTGSHLWFLYYLALVTSIALLVRTSIRASGPLSLKLLSRIDALSAHLGSTAASPWILAIPTSLGLWFMNTWSMDTPDRTLVPHWPVLLIYGGFFGFGWFLARNQDALHQHVRLSAPRWLTAGLAASVLLVLGDIERDPAHPHFVLAHMAFVGAYAVTMWSFSFLTLGVFHRFCHRANPAARYVADASYWMYLIHLPLVLWLQIGVAELPFHWSLKWAGIVVLTVGFSLLSYQWFVRTTWIGRILNGSRP